MNIIKNLREQNGYTQNELAQKTRISLRTIQRLESKNKTPKGYTLNAICEVFNIEPSELKERFEDIKSIKESEITSIQVINLSVLSCLGIPFGNIIIPFILWKRRRTSAFVNEVGKQIINFQIIWSIMLCISLCIAPFINVFDLPLILIVLLLALIINIIIVGITASKIRQNNFEFLNIPIQFL